MPRYWGNWTATSSTGARYRLGMDWSRSGTRVTVDRYLFESAFSIYKDITLTRTGRLSGTYSVSVSTSGGVVSLGRGASVTGSRGGSVTIGGRATNVLHGLVPTFSHTISIPAVAPSAPGRPSVSNLTSSSVRNAWSAPSSNGGASITNYQVEYSRPGATSTYNNGTSRSRTQSLNAPNTTYTVRVRARNSAGYGPWSSSRSFTTPPLRPNAPGTPTWLAGGGDDQTTVNWSRNATSARPYNSQRVQRRVYNNGWGSWSTRATVSATATSWVDQSISENRAYQYRIQAVNSSGTATSGSSSSRFTAPWQVNDLEARATSSGIRVSWQDRVRYNSYDYQIQHREDGGSWSTIHTRGNADHASTVTWTHQNPDLTVTHQYRVRSRHTSSALNRYSPWSETNVVRLAAPPSAPTNLGPSGVWDASEDRTLTWRHVPTDDSDQERFQVRHRLQGGSWTTVSAVASESEQWTLPGGTYEPGDTIEWQVRTMGVHPDWSPWSASNFQSPTSRPTVAINTPLDGEEVETNSVLVTWGYSGPDQDDGDEGEITGQAAWRLTVLRGSNVVTEESGSDDRDEFLVRGLSDDATYTVQVEVRSGEGLWSAEPDEVTISVSYLPPPPPQIGVAFDRDLGAAVVDVQTAPPHEPYEYVNVVTNPRGRPADTGVDADPLAARQALLDAIAAFTDAPVQWSATEPGDTSVVWVDPGTGVGRVWSAGVDGSVDDVVTRNLFSNPSFETGTDGVSSGNSVQLSRNFATTPYSGDSSLSITIDEDASVFNSRVFQVVDLSDAQQGDWLAWSLSMRRSTFPARGLFRFIVTFQGDGSQQFLSGYHSLTADQMDVSPRFAFAAQIPAGSFTTAEMRLMFYDEVGNAPSFGGILHTDAWFATVAPTQAEALNSVADYFDGDTPERRTDNIIYRYAWEDEPHASPSTETALGQGWHEITDPDVVAAGEAYADAITALAPIGWDGAGLWWSVEHDAVYVPQGTEATVPTAALPETVTLVLLDAETGESAQHWDRSDATIPADTVGRYLRAAIVEGGMFTGPYFDGDYPRGAGQDGSLATYTWDGEPHDSATTATITSLETESVQLWRAIDDGPWLLIADEVPPDTAISDPIPAIGDRRVNHYRATSVSGIGSAMHSDEHQLVVPTHGPGGNHGWVYLNGGPDFSDVVKVRANATRSGSQGLAKTVRRYAGNPRPQEVSGTAVSRTWSIGVNARETLYEDGMSRPEEIEALQVDGGTICYRDPLGARWFASMGMTDDSYQAITGEVSWSMEEVDQPEGLARESRDQSGDDDDDGGEPV